MLTWRNLLVITVLSLLSGLAGSWIGSWQYTQRNFHHSLQRGTVREITKGALDLTPEQNILVSAFEARYLGRFEEVRRSIGQNNKAISQAIIEEQSEGPKVKKALDDIQISLLTLERESVLYVLEVRKILRTDQRVIFDAKIAEAWD